MVNMFTRIFQNIFQQNFKKYEGFLHDDVDQRPMAICRIVFGTITFFHYLSNFKSVQIFFGPDGFLGARFWSHIVNSVTLSSPQYYNFQVLKHVQSPNAIYVLYFLLLLASLLFTLGIFTRTSGILTAVLHLLFTAQNEYPVWNWAFLMHVFILYIVFSGAGSCYSVDAWRAKRNWREAFYGPAWPMRVLQFHTCVCYFTIAWTRIDDYNWQQGQVLYSILDDPLFSRINIDWAFAKPILSVGTRLAWAFELGAGFLLWSRKIALWWVPGLVVMHLGIDFAAHVGQWNYILIAILISFVWPKRGK